MPARNNAARHLVSSSGVQRSITAWVHGRVRSERDGARCVLLEEWSEGAGHPGERVCRSRIPGLRRLLGRASVRLRPECHRPEESRRLRRSSLRSRRRKSTHRRNPPEDGGTTGDRSSDIHSSGRDWRSPAPWPGANETWLSSLMCFQFLDCFRYKTKTAGQICARNRPAANGSGKENRHPPPTAGACMKTDGFTGRAELWCSAPAYLLLSGLLLAVLIWSRRYSSALSSWRSLNSGLGFFSGRSRRGMT